MRYCSTGPKGNNVCHLLVIVIQKHNAFTPFQPIIEEVFGNFKVAEASDQGTSVNERIVVRA